MSQSFSSQSFSKSAAVGLAAFGLLHGAALAQQGPIGPPKPPPADSVLNGVEVTSPRTISRERYGLVSQEVNMSVKVPYDDLDMRTPAGVAELDKRVTEAARYVCGELQAMYPAGTPERFYCVKDAIGGAQPQVVKASAPG
jgi:UrcA family protein